MGIGEPDCPIATHIGKSVPGAAFIGSPGRRARVEIRRGFGRDHNGAFEVVIVVFCLVVMVLPLHVGDTRLFAFAAGLS